MSHTIVSFLCLAAACLVMAGCATAPSTDRAQKSYIPLAATHADIGFTLTSGSRRDLGCDGDANCPAAAANPLATRFSRQVLRVAAILQGSALLAYPDMASRVPGMADGRFDVYVVDGDTPCATSSSNGRIALCAELGAGEPHDDWMAFVIAREMGHVIARHHEENSTASILTSVLMNIIIPGSSLLKSALSAGASGVAAKSKRDVQAREADAIARKLLQAAGVRLGDVALALLVAPVLLDDGAWSKEFRNSAEQLVAAAAQPQLAVAALR